jgi:hypothetical protein
MTWRRRRAPTRCAHVPYSFLNLVLPEHVALRSQGLIRRSARNRGLYRLIHKAHFACSWPAPAAFASRFDLGLDQILDLGSRISDLGSRISGHRPITDGEPAPWSSLRRDRQELERRDRARHQSRSGARYQAPLRLRKPRRARYQRSDDAMANPLDMQNLREDSTRC